MVLKCKTLISLSLLLAATCAFGGTARAETGASGFENTSEAIEKAFFENDRDFYSNRSFWRQLDWMLGPGALFKNSFPENEIARDAEKVNKVYRDALRQQVGNDPYIRTPDLPNPYNTSILTSPRSNPNRLRSGTEYRFEVAPPR